MKGLMLTHLPLQMCGHHHLQLRHGELIAHFVAYTVMYGIAKHAQKSILGKLATNIKPPVLGITERRK